MKLSQKSLSAVEAAICKATERYAGTSEQAIVTDIHLQPNPSTGTLTLFNDDDEQLALTPPLEEWEAYEGENFYGGAERVLSALLNSMNAKGCFEQVNILKPYSFVLVDEDKETVAELLLMDDDTLLANDPLLKDLDEELDAFLKDLLDQ